MLLQTKKAAMFGLDARIALAIFGTLSVISGAALYSAIQESRVTALIADLNEVSKALEQYILDTGQEPPASVGFYLDTTKLVSSTITGWKGPYLSADTIATYNLKHTKYNHIGITKGKKFGYSDGDSLAHDELCDVTVCDIYVYINGVPHDIAVSIDRKIDGSDSIDSGRVYLAYGFTGASSIFNTSVGLKVMPSLNKP